MSTVAHYNEKKDLFYLENPSPETPEEAARLKKIEDTGLLDTQSEARFDRIVQAAAIVTNSPIALVSLVLKNRSVMLNPGNGSRHGMVWTPQKRHGKSPSVPTTSSPIQNRCLLFQMRPKTQG